MDRWSITHDGKLKINGKLLSFQSLRLVKEIGSGANGVVFECENTTLERKEALKVWLKLRKKDTREKSFQGRLEAIKAASTKGPTPTIYFAGIQDGYFFVAMEFVRGETLKSYLCRKQLTLLEKMNLAREYVDLMGSFNDVIHGDPHHGNVMIAERGTMILLDFGTSVIFGEKQCEERHWRIIEETFSRIMFPFEFLRIMGASYSSPPKELDPYFDFTEEFFNMLWFIGLRPKGKGMSIFYEDQERDLSFLDENMRRALQEIKISHSDYLENEENLGSPWFY